MVCVDNSSLQAAISIFLQLYLKLAIHSFVSRSLLQMFLRCCLSLQPFLLVDHPHSRMPYKFGRFCLYVFKLKLLRSMDLFRCDLKAFLFHSVYGHRDTDFSVMHPRSSSMGCNTSVSVSVSFCQTITFETLHIHICTSDVSPHSTGQVCIWRSLGHRTDKGPQQVHTQGMPACHNKFASAQSKNSIASNSTSITHSVEVCVHHRIYEYAHSREIWWADPVMMWSPSSLRDWK